MKRSSLTAALLLAASLALRAPVYANEAQPGDDRGNDVVIAQGSDDLNGGVDVLPHARGGDDANGGVDAQPHAQGGDDANGGVDAQPHG